MVEPRHGQQRGVLTGVNARLLRYSGCKEMMRQLQSSVVGISLINYIMNTSKIRKKVQLSDLYSKWVDRVGQKDLHP